MSTIYLCDEYHALEKAMDADSLYKDTAPLLVEAQSSVRHRLRPYQEHALKRFFHYETQYRNKNGNNHILFEMATGTGKTLLMATLLPYFYRQGYRTFLFFVNSTSIIEKTKQNFIDAYSSKYVFASPIVLDGQRVEVRAVTSIAEVNPSCINIVFTTIQGLHSNMQNTRENSVTLEDFAEQKVVLLADEAHHTSTETKAGLKLVRSWEGTVDSIYKQHAENYLLEFTATADLDKAAVSEKYRDKILVRYGLRDFRNDGFSKHIHLAQTKTESLKERFLLSIILSQYRQEIAAKYALAIKPVVLYKSKTIQESKKAEACFHDLIEQLQESDIDELLLLVKKYESTVLYRAVYAFFTSGEFSHAYLAQRLRINFSADKTINVNKDSELASMQVALNTLEDAMNKYRVIFAVDKLNEGWDVLNLYDIVKLYETPTTQGNPPTTQEIQLIGRGARLFPFIVERGQEKYKRKYDFNNAHELSVLEQLHFHTADGSAFIQQLNKNLEQVGLIDRQMIEKEIRLKESFVQSDMYKYGRMYGNERVKRERQNIFQTDLFGGITSNSTRKEDDPFSAVSGTYKIDVMFDVFDVYEKKPIKDFEYTKEARLKLEHVPDAVFLKAVARVKNFYFENVKEKLILGSILDIKTRFKTNTLSVLYPKEYTKAEVLTPQVLLNVTIRFLTNLSKLIYDQWTEYVGSETLKPKKIKDVFTSKKVLVNESNKADNGMFVCESVPYFAQEQIKATGYERELVQDVCARLEESHMPVKWLIRNERHFRLYNVEDGKPFEPDFLLMLENDEKHVYQIFMEPKGEHLQEFDRWKERLMQGFEALETGEMKYTIVGMPFYSPQAKPRNAFLEKLQKCL